MQPSDLTRVRRDVLTRQGVLEAIVDAERYLAREAARRPDLAERIEVWRARVTEIPSRLETATARVAFVGAVKSGKSTLVNALLGQDLLPRGSGVLTAQATEVVGASEGSVHLVWKGRRAVNDEVVRHLTHLDPGGPECPGLDLWDLVDREAVAEVLEAAGPSPHAPPLASLLEGFERVGARLGSESTEEVREGLGDLSHWVARDEVAAYLWSIRIETPTPDLPSGVALLDCPGADAWNAAHGREVDETLLGAHRLVYVVSSRVGMREADHRMLERLARYGLAPLTRVVVNVDLGELRTPEELDRVLDGVREGARAQGITGPLHAFSALQLLLDRRMLLDPAGVAPGERRLLEVWETAAGGLAARSRDNGVRLREALWAEVATERERFVTGRARADLRRVVVEAAGVLGAGGVAAEGAVWKADATDALLGWLRERMALEEQDAAGRCAEVMGRAFADRRSPQRRAWVRRVKNLSPEPVGTLADRAEAVLADTEPLRVNAIRNLALEARGALARGAETLAREAAQTLREAGLDPGAPPARGELSRQISVTRKIPLFRGRPVEQGCAGSARWADGLRRGGARLLGADRARRAETATRQAVLLRHLASRWHGYLDEIQNDCLVPHVAEVAAQIYDAVAEWILDSLPRTKSQLL